MPDPFTHKESRVSHQSWMRAFDRPILMIPGPTEIPSRVLRAMAQPPMIQYEPPFDEEVLEPACLDLRQVFQTSGEVLVMPGSGRTGLEAAALSLVEPGDRAVVVVAGVFGQLIYINWDHQLVAVKLSSWPEFINVTFNIATLRAIISEARRWWP